MARTAQSARRMRERDMDPVDDGPVEEPVKDEDMDNQVKHLESRYEKGYAQIFEAGQAPPTSGGGDKYQKYTFCCTQFFNKEGHPVRRTIDIKSKPVKKALKEMIKDYPNISFSTSLITLQFPLQVLWFYQNQIYELAEAEKEKDTLLGKHISTLADFLKEEFKSINKEYKSLTAEGLITYDLLWTLFKPGKLVYSKIYGQQRVLQLESYNYTSDNCGVYLALYCMYVDYDGSKFGESKAQLSVRPWTGSRKITDLNAVPLDRLAKKDAISKRLVERGNKFVALQGCHCKKYTGVAIESTQFGPTKVPISGRIMVDAKTHGLFNPNEAKKLTSIIKIDPDSHNDDYDDDEYDKRYQYAVDPTFDEQPEESITVEVNGDGPVKSVKKKKKLELDDDHLLLCSPLVWGFSLDSKKWLQFFVDNIQEVVWNTEAFSKLVLPEDTKELIRGLVENHIDENSGFDDFVEGKGKGLISVLHGDPGLGKTMTAETVAEYTKSPLYTVSAGSLGVDAESMEHNLERILKLCTIWKAVLLLDEADVYLEERSLQNIHRNALVSIFLRLLEYYQGILFLTTNRVRTFDHAFQSRIHIALRYNDLTPEARSQVWKNFVAKIESSGIKTDFYEQDYKELSLQPLNGRQIKNTTRTALSIANRRGETLGLSHVKIVLGVVDAFEKDFQGAKRRRKSVSLEDLGIGMYM